MAAEVERKVKMKEKYNYTKKMEEIFKCLNSVKKARTHANVCCGKERKLHDTLRKAYLTELKVDLMILNSLLNEWSYDGCKIERDEDEQLDT